MTGEPYVATAETHTGAVWFVGDLAYKIKKPVSLGFVDWSAREDRIRAVDTELSLNRRLSPDVYLGTGWLPRPGGEDEPVLVMRRLPADRRLSTMVTRGDPVDDFLRGLARQLAAFHLAAETTSGADEAARAPATRRRWEVNHERLRPSFGRWVDAELAEAVLRDACTYLDGRRALLDARADAGWARDGHGDLLADDVFCLPDGVRVLDCLDFDERLRVGDVLADVAFLAMDLDHLGRPDLGWRLLELHRGFAGDAWPASLAHHFIAYRSQVRCLVSCVRAEQGVVSAQRDAAALLELAARHLTLGRVRLILVGGPPGTGKSTLATGIGERLGVAVLRSDVIRKELAGLAASDRAGADLGGGIYGSTSTTRTYEEMLRRASELVERGESVVLDATWGDESLRASARDLASHAHTSLLELRCSVDEQTARRRVETRGAAGADASDADAAVAAALAASFQPWPTAVIVDTAQSVEASLEEALRVLELRRAMPGPSGPAV